MYFIEGKACVKQLNQHVLCQYILFDRFFLKWFYKVESSKNLLKQHFKKKIFLYVFVMGFI